MSKFIGSTPFRELLCNSIAEDETIQRAADVLDGVLNKSVKSIPDLLLFARLSNDVGFVTPTSMLPPMTRLADLSGGLVELPENVLDFLAWQFHVDGYESALDIRGKRELVQRSIQLHRKKGTPWAVETALNSILHLPIYVVEWFEYGGEPYHFRVRMDVSKNSFSDADAAGMLPVIEEYKNVRSWCDGLSAYSKKDLELNVTTSNGSTRIRNKTGLWQPEPDVVSLFFVPSTVTSTRVRTTHKIYFQKPNLPDLTERVSIGSIRKFETRAFFWQEQSQIEEARNAFAIGSSTRVKSHTHIYFRYPEQPKQGTKIGIGSIRKFENKAYLWQQSESTETEYKIAASSIKRIRNSLLFWQGLSEQNKSIEYRSISPIIKIKSYPCLWQKTTTDAVNNTFGIGTITRIRSQYVTSGDSTSEQ